NDNDNDNDNEDDDKGEEDYTPDEFDNANDGNDDGIDDNVIVFCDGKFGIVEGFIARRIVLKNDATNNKQKLGFEYLTKIANQKDPQWIDEDELQDYFHMLDMFEEEMDEEILLTHPKLFIQEFNLLDTEQPLSLSQERSQEQPQEEEKNN
ncbi:hypothetical protein RFI_23060, partial [Reticulomyxa filosa]